MFREIHNHVMSVGGALGGKEAVPGWEYVEVLSVMTHFLGKALVQPVGAGAVERNWSTYGFIVNKVPRLLLR